MIPFYVTDHSPDFEDTGSQERLRQLYADIAKDGICQVRYDWRWKLIEPELGKIDNVVLKRYADAANIMADIGLEPPTIVLSNIPDWALKRSQSELLVCWRDYVSRVVEEFSDQCAQKIPCVQVLNELNNSFYTPVASEVFAELYHVAREICTAYNPDIRLLGTILAGNLGPLIAKVGIRISSDVLEYIDANAAMLQAFDVIAIDYYPGLWHVPRNEARRNRTHIFSEVTLLRQTIERLASLGIAYEIGEVGLPTNTMFWKDQEYHEKRQRYFFNLFFRALKNLIRELGAEGIRGPERIGLYEALDEPPRNTAGKFMRLTPFPEHDMGLRHPDGSPKQVLLGNRHMRYRTGQEPSRLSQLIKYLNS